MNFIEKMLLLEQQQKELDNQKLSLKDDFEKFIKDILADKCQILRNYIEGKMFFIKQKMSLKKKPLTISNEMYF